MNTLIQIGGCNSGWQENNTPIQRLVGLTNFFDKIVLVDREKEKTPYVDSAEYIRVSNFSFDEIFSVLKRFENNNVTVWFGPSGRVAAILLALKFFFKFRMVLDLYDHERLSSGIAFAAGRHLRGCLYYLIENFTIIAAKRADILVSAISENRYSGLPHRVKAVNGVAFDRITGLTKISANRSDFFVASYVGLSNYERTPVFLKMLQSGVMSNFKLMLIGDCDKEFLSALKNAASKLINVEVESVGFLPWESAMQFVRLSDLCLYPFPTREELDCVYPIKMGEYMTLGKAVISSDSSAIREVFSECVGVIRCDTTDPVAWATTLQRCVHDRSRVDALGQLNRAFAASNLDWKVTQKKLLDRVQELLLAN